MAQGTCSRYSLYCNYATVQSQTLYWWTRNRREEKKRKVFKTKRLLYATDLIGDILIKRVSESRRSHADWTNRPYSGKINRKEKKTKLSVSSLLIKSL